MPSGVLTLFQNVSCPFRVTLALRHCAASLFLVIQKLLSLLVEVTRNGLRLPLAGLLFELLLFYR